MEEDEGILPNEQQSQSSQPTQEVQFTPTENNNDIRVDCTDYFKTDKVFSTRDEILGWAKLQGRQSGCGLTIKLGKEARNGRAPRLYLMCERGGKYKHAGQRKCVTKKCACPFELKTTWSLDSEKEWKAKVVVINGIHNHELAKTTEGHGFVGKLTRNEFNIVADMTKAGVKPKEVMHALRKNDPEHCTSLQQIYNARTLIRAIDGKSQVQQRPMETNDSIHVDFNCNLKRVMDVCDGSTKKLKIVTTSSGDETRYMSPPKVDRVNSAERNVTEEVENVDGGNYVPGPPMEDKGNCPKEDKGNSKGDDMRGIESLLGDMLSDDVGGSLENSSNLSASASSIPNPDDTLPAIIDCQHVEQLLTLPAHKPSSKSLGEEINLCYDDVNFNTNMELDVDVDDENRVASTQMEDEGLLPDEQQLQSSQPTQEVQLIPVEKNSDIRVDCTHHFKTDKVFRTKEEILHWAKLQGRQSGCVLTIKLALEARNRRAPRLYLICERGGKYDGSSSKGPRKVVTKKCSCPFELKTTWSSDGEKEWKAKVVVVNGVHNHQLLKFTEGHAHSSAGRLTKNELGMVANMAKDGIRPRDILLALRKNDPGNCTSRQQIYNAMTAMRTKNMNGKSATQNLPKELAGNSETTSSQNEVLNEIRNFSAASTLKPSNVGKLTKNELGIVANMAMTGTRPREILCALRKNDPDNCTSLQQIYNAIYAMKTEDMDGKSVTENLPEKLTDSRETTTSQNEVLNEIGHFSNASPSMLEPSDACETTCKLIRSNSDAISLPERVRRLEKIVGLGGSAEMSIEIVSDAISLPERVKRLENVMGIRDSAELSQSFPKGRGDIENCVLDTPKGRGDVENCVLETPLEDGSVDCSSQFKTDKEFRTKEEVLHWAKVKGRETGASIVMSVSQEPDGFRAPRLYLICDRGGKYKSPADQQRLRKRGSKKCACPFELGTTWSRPDGEEWIGKVFVRNGFHNHPLEKFKESCNQMGKLKKEELNIIAVLAKAGVKASEIMKALRKNDPANCTTSRQLYNAISASKSKEKRQEVESSTE